MIKKLYRLLIITIIITASNILSHTSYAELTITPLKIIFDEKDRSKEVHLINTSNTTNTYRISWMYYKANETGAPYSELDEPLDKEHNPADMIRFSPRQVTIPPNGRQKIRLSLRRPADLPDGEYRAHMRFQKLINQDEFNRIANEPNERGAKLAVMVNLGFSIPIVVRQGKYDSSASITDVHFMKERNPKTNKPRISVTLTRQGIHSPNGHVVIFWEKPDGTEKQIGILNNVSIYTEIKKRTIEIDINEEAINDGKIRVSYEGDLDQKGRTYDEIIIPVQ